MWVKNITRKKQIMVKSLYLSLIASCVFFSCNNEVVYSKYQPVQDHVWDKQAKYSFSFEITDSSTPYDISIQLRHSDIYPYQNLWVLFEEFQPSNAAVKDTVEWMLADNSGRWTGNGITLFQNKFLLKKNHHFPDTGTYTVNLRHGMRDDRLKGIEDIGLLVEKGK